MPDGGTKLLPSLQRAGAVMEVPAQMATSRPAGVEPGPVRDLAKTEGCDKAQGLEWGNLIFES